MKNKYIPHRDILYINIVSPNNDQKIMQIPRAFLLGGKHKFENGGRLTDKYTYIPKRNVKLIVLTDDTEIKDFSNGFWVDNKILDKKYSATKSDEQTAIEFLTNARNNYLAQKTNIAKKILRGHMVSPVVEDGLKESLQTKSPKLLSLLFELYNEFIPKSKFNYERPLALIYTELDVDFEDSKKVMDIVSDKYLSLNYKIKPIAIARTKPLEEQPQLLKLVNSFTMKDAFGRPLVAIKADNGRVIASDAHTLLQVILPGEKSERLIRVSKEAKEAKIENKFPDVDFIIGQNAKQYGKSFVVNKSDLKLLIDHLNAIIEYGLTSAGTEIAILKMPNGSFIGFNTELLLRSLTAMVAIGHDRVQLNYATFQKAIIITPTNLGTDRFNQGDCAVCMPVFISSSGFNYFYWDVKNAKVVTTPKDYQTSEDIKFEKGGQVDGQMELFDEDIDIESMYALGGDVPVSDPLEHEQLYTIYNVKTGTDKHSAIVAQEVIDIVKTDAGQDAENINTLEQARVYLEQNGYILDELEPEFALGGGLADNMSVSDIAKLHNVSKEDIEYQLKKGIQVEMEHTGNRMTAREIAMDHLVESPEYYTLLENMEQQFARGGKIGFKALAKKVSNAYVGKPVPAQYRGLYGKTYSKQEADKVGNKVAAKVYRQQLNK